MEKANNSIGKGISLIVREAQTKSTKKSHTSSTRMTEIKKIIASVGLEVEKPKPGQSHAFLRQHFTP